LLRTLKAEEILKVLADKPMPAVEFNSGALGKLIRNRKVEQYYDVSPYETHKGGKIVFVKLK